MGYKFVKTKNAKKLLYDNVIALYNTGVSCGHTLSMNFDSKLL